MEWFAIGALILYSMYLNVRSDYRLIVKFYES